MSKSLAHYWNPLDAMNVGLWSQVLGMETMLEELILSIDEESGAYTKLTRYFPNHDMTDLDPRTHDYPEEIFVFSGRIYDASVDLWLEQGYYVSRPAGEVHGPFKTDAEGCVLLEIAPPN